MKLLRTSVFLAALCLAAPARAAGPAITVPAGAGQQALGLGVDAGGVRARVCTAAPCAPDGGVLLAPPEGPKPRFDEAKVSIVALEGGHALGRADVPGDVEGSVRVILVAGKGSEPVVVWSGWTGVPRGESGEEQSAAVVVERLAGGAGGASRVLVGERRADVTLCGRPTLVAARALDPATLELTRGASVQNLGDDERTRAHKLVAERSREAVASPARVLRATAASSAFEKKLAALTDGNPATAWSENKVGPGRGEFVTMSAPEEVGITALDVIVRPTEDVPDGAAPKRFYLATPGELFEVTMPEDAWKQPAGTRYTIKLPAELHTACLAVVLEESFGRGDPRVTLAEIEAHTAFDGATPAALSAALGGGGNRSRAAAALLVRAGPAGVAAVAAAYDKLDDRGRQLAGEVMDAAPCSEQVPFFAARFAAATSEASGQPGHASPAPLEVDPDLAHARDRLRRCGRASAPALVELLAKGAPRTRVLAADELAVLAPAAALSPLLDAMTAADDALRRDLRAALARAARSPRALSAIGDELAADRLATRSETVAIDLLRAIGPNLGKVEAGPRAFADLVARATSFRSRYLLQAPAADLGRAGDAVAASFLRRSLREEGDPHVRARAAEVAGSVPSLAVPLVEALGDADPRVRQAALNAVAGTWKEGASPPPGAASPAAALRERLSRDDWTFVRAGAARALGALPADVETDRALAAALADGSFDVRGRALDGLGAHRATAHAEAVRERQDDTDESLEVRARAILALAAMCDTRSLDEWTKLARAARIPHDDQSARLGGAAIAALGQVHPADLASRIGMLFEKDTPPAAREMAKAAVAAPGGCAK